MGHKVVDVAQRLGISDKSLYLWLRQSNGKQSIASNDDVVALKAEMSRLKAELKRTTEERDILKKADVLCQGVRVKYAFIDAHRNRYRPN